MASDNWFYKPSLKSKPLRMTISSGIKLESTS